MTTDDDESDEDDDNSLYLSHVKIKKDSGDNWALAATRIIDFSATAAPKINLIASKLKKECEFDHNVSGNMYLSTITGLQNDA